MLVLAVAAALPLPSSWLIAQELERATIAAGGGTASGGAFEVASLAGQPLAGRAEGDSYILYVGGLFPRPGSAGSLIFTDGFEASPLSRHSEIDADTEQDPDR